MKQYQSARNARIVALGAEVRALEESCYLDDFDGVMFERYEKAKEELKTLKTLHSIFKVCAQSNNGTFCGEVRVHQDMKTALFYAANYMFGKGGPLSTPEGAVIYLMRSNGYQVEHLVMTKYFKD